LQHGAFGRRRSQLASSWLSRKSRSALFTRAGWLIKAAITPARRQSTLITGENPNERSISTTWLVHAARDLALLDAEFADGSAHAGGAAQGRLAFPLGGKGSWRNSWLARPPDELWPNTRAATAVPLAMPPAFWVTLLPEFDWSENSAAAPYQFPVRDAFAGIGGETIRKPPTEPGLEPTGVTAPTSPVGRPLNPVPHFTVRAMFCCLPPSRNRHRRRRIFGRGCVRPCPTKTCATTPAHTCTRRC
jgi:hypothetical protein